MRAVHCEHCLNCLRGAKEARGWVEVRWMCVCVCVRKWQPGKRDHHSKARSAYGIVPVAGSLSETNGHSEPNRGATAGEGTGIIEIRAGSAMNQRRCRGRSGAPPTPTRLGSQRAGRPVAEGQLRGVPPPLMVAWVLLIWRRSDFPFSLRISHSFLAPQLSPEVKQDR